MLVTSKCFYIVGQHSHRNQTPFSYIALGLSMRIEVIHLVGALLVPLLVAASNVTFSNGTASASTEGLLSSNAGW